MVIGAVQVLTVIGEQILVACFMLMNINTSTAWDGLDREQWIVQTSEHLLPAKFLVLVFPSLVQEPSECYREQLSLLVIGLDM